MLRTPLWSVALALLAVAPAPAADAKYRIKQANTPPPQELNESIRKLLGKESIQLLDAKGVICELWFRKELPVKPTPEQIKNGLSYQDLPESTLFGAVRYDQSASDYRKQTIKPGVYTLRLGFQPMDGDHMGTAPYPNFLLLLPAKADPNPGSLETKSLQNRSARAIGGSHPGVLLLYPNEKPQATPSLVDKGEDTWVLNREEPLAVDGRKAPTGLGMGLTLVGHSAAE